MTWNEWDRDVQRGNVELVLGEPTRRSPESKNLLAPFIAWDGEGISNGRGDFPDFDFEHPKMSFAIWEVQKPQDYVLFGCSANRFVKAPSLSTEQCLNLLLQVESEHPNAIHIGFSLKYDVNMILKDLPMEKLKIVFKQGVCHWHGYRIEYRPGKWLAINRKAKDGPRSPTVKLFDVFGFFQCSFVKACEDLLGKNDPELVAIREGKAARQSFTYDQLDSFILPYMQAELRMMVRLMDSLRHNLLSANLNLRSWHGAGAVASLILRQQNVRRAMAPCPPEVNEAARYAYAGGRFELFKTGYYPGKVYEYDIRSAYPSGMRNLPNLAKGQWRRSDEYIPDRFSVWYIRYYSGGHGSAIQPPQPLFRRHRQGMVSYPDQVNGWYWAPEAELVRPGHIRYGYVFEPDDPEDLPFSFVEDMYETRRRWKAEGNSAQMAYKLGLNSLYGKMAQRVGGQDKGPPPYHQLEWAGYVTSATRAKLFHAMRLAGDDLIAVETDALFSTKPLDLDIGSGLGQWEETVFDAICYIQNGFYYAWEGDNVIEKYRGFDKGSVPVARVLDHLREYDRCRNLGIKIPPKSKLNGFTTRFIGFGLAVNTKSVWRSWETNKHRGICIGGNTKRSHEEAICPYCRQGKEMVGNLHPMAINADGGDSWPHSLPWAVVDDDERHPWEVDKDWERF